MRIAIAVVLLALLAAPLAGCGPKVKTITTTETIECAERDDYGSDYGFEEEPGRDCTEVRRETTVVTERSERESSCHGAISCSVSLVGGLVTLPFRILGEVLDTIF